MDLNSQLADLVGKLNQMLDHAGPGAQMAAQVAGHAYQLRAIGWLLTFPVAALIAIVSVPLCLKAVLWMANHTWDTWADTTTYEEARAVATAIVSGLLGLLFFPISLGLLFNTILDPLVWASAFDPTTALAAHILHLF